MGRNVRKVTAQLRILRKEASYRHSLCFLHIFRKCLQHRCLKGLVFYLVFLKPWELLTCKEEKHIIESWVILRRCISFTVEIFEDADLAACQCFSCGQFLDSSKEK